jgi:CRP/FNR family transcriptional regulator, cyclic AMP receptor protein
VARDEKLELLRQVPLFAGIGRRELERLGMLTDEIDLPKGRVLMRQGDRGEEMFIILSGSARVEREGVFVVDRGAGDWMGEIALVDEGPRTATVTLTSDSRLLVIGHAGFHALMDEFPEVRLRVLESLARRVRSAEPDAVH